MTDSPDKLAALKAAVEAMTPGPWEVDPTALRDIAAGDRLIAATYGFDAPSPGTREDNAAGIVALRNAGPALVALAEAAVAEVLEQGYRSTDMATAIKALLGEFWFETYVPDVPDERCTWTVTTQLDDGPCTQRCILNVHSPSTSHKFRPAFDALMETP